jgi:hypothetical protein
MPEASSRAMALQLAQRNLFATAWKRVERCSGLRTRNEGIKIRSRKANPPMPVTAAIKWIHCMRVVIGSALELAGFYASCAGVNKYEVV